MSEGPKSTLNLDGLPTPIIVAALDVLTLRIYQGVFESRTELQARQEFEMWLKPSWSRAEGLLLSPESFAEWIKLGEWNISKDEQKFSYMKDCTSIAGKDGWKIAALDMTVQQAIDQISEEGLEGFIEGLDAVIALKKMNQERFS